MANYNSTYTGQEVDNAVGRALPDGTIDVDIRGKQDKLSQAQLSATNSGITAEKVTKYDGYEQELDNKQNALPDVVNDRYLHTNALTGELEWKVGVSKGTDDYNDLLNKPKINDVELEGNITADDLGVQEKLTPAQLEAVNSEVTSEWKNTIDGDITSLEVGKQDKLTSQQISNINRALVSPIATSTEKRIVAVDEQNNQIQVKIGENLSIEGTTSPFTLNAQGGGGESKLVEVTYGVTTYNEVKAIVDGGKIPYINETEGLYFISRVLEASIRFAVVFNNTTYQIGVDVDNNWSKFTSVSENVSNKANTILPTSTTNYPSSKAVADYVAQHSGGGWTLLWQNANPSSEFRAQTLNFSSASSKFNTVVIEYINYDYAYRPVLTKFHYRLSSGFDLVEDTLVKNIDITTQNITLYSRKMYVASGSTGTNVSIHFEDSYKHTITFANDNSMVSEKLNSSLIPLFIYGVN